MIKIPDNVKEADPNIKSCDHLQVKKWAGINPQTNEHMYEDNLIYTEMTDEQKFEKNTLVFKHMYSARSGGGFIFTDKNDNTRTISMNDIEPVFSAGTFSQMGGRLLLSGIFRFVKRGSAVLYQPVQLNP